MAKEEFGKKLNSAVFPGLQGGPLEHVVAAKAVSFFEAATPEYTEYIGQVIKNAQAMADVFNASDLRVISGGTDNHLLLLDVTSSGLNGKQVEKLLDTVEITVNKNTIPFETLGANKASGIRIGTPAITTRGLKEAEARKIAELIVETIQNHTDEAKLDEIRAAVHAITKAFPLHKKLVSTEA
ncbi:Serine hydroxymethyltransferase [bioreactor metagenome]|uniref:Serine hydroxymethyltransferase n=1 Tax=bioreactor metagenome TaxID=1076179 RepID=A0A645GCE7_9ZZZZ